ncbi:MAG: flavin reductase [Komagataeibacter saccharivorans]|uniref:flavin reductase n=1 Tax=Komagataeibacter saccharivorans TaxID=265959 RepID=UPI0039E7F0F7
MIDQSLFREAMSHLGAAVSIITTDGDAGRAGMTVSAVCSVTDTPPTLLVCINTRSRSHDAFVKNGVICVNVLSSGHQELSGLFASKADNETRCGQARWHERTGGAPVLEDAIVSFDCTIENVSTVGTHSVLFCVVRNIEIGTDGAGLIYFRRGYHPIGMVGAEQTGAA